MMVLLVLKQIGFHQGEHRLEENTDDDAADDNTKEKQEEPMTRSRKPNYLLVCFEIALSLLGAFCVAFLSNASGRQLALCYLAPEQVSTGFVLQLHDNMKKSEVDGMLNGWSREVWLQDGPYYADWPISKKWVGWRMYRYRRGGAYVDVTYSAKNLVLSASDME